jgi:hypothetical protein
MIDYNRTAPHGAWAHPSITKHFNGSNKIKGAYLDTIWLDTFMLNPKLNLNTSTYKPKVGMEDPYPPPSKVWTLPLTTPSMNRVGFHRSLFFII